MRPFSLLVTLAYLLAIVGCSSGQAGVKWPKYDPEPLDPPLEEKSVLPKKEGGPSPMMQGTMANFDGILIDEYTATRYKIIQADRDFLRKLIAAERKARSEVQESYNTTLDSLQAAAKRGWWERNVGWVGLTIGVVVTGFLAIGLAAGLNGVK